MVISILMLVDLHKDVTCMVSMFGENTCNASGNRLLFFMNEVELMFCNGRKFVSEPELTRFRPNLKQKSIIDYIITDPQLLKCQEMCMWMVQI